ncbi:MAG: putative zinc-binding metallopeptidase [Chromatiales bacterium]
MKKKALPAPECRTLAPDQWINWPDERLLDLRFCDLQLSLEGSPVADRIAQLHGELEARSLAFRPHFWLSEEWFTPDGVPGIAIPFYLVHPRLARLELNQMLEVEGGTPEWCMRILRHETGHAIENGYFLRRRQRRQKLFGKSSVPYPDYYTPKPYSKRFVLHLDMWYAQSHPDEDFAETFAVWLQPDSNWRERYAGWPAMKKLQYMDELMAELAGKPSPAATQEIVDPLTALRTTLREHYKRKRDHYGPVHPTFYDRDLGRLFSDAPHHGANKRAAAFLSRIRKEVRRKVADWTGAYQYTIDQVLEGMIERCRERRLRLAVPEEQAKLDFLILLTVQTMNCMHSGRRRVAL